VEYLPDANYAGSDELTITVSDHEFTTKMSMPIIITPLSDPITLVCPAAVDILEGAHRALIGYNISVEDTDQLPGASDDDVEVSVEMTVSAGTMALIMPQTLGTLGSAPGLDRPDDGDFTQIPMIRFNTTLEGLRGVLDTLAYTPYPNLFNGIVRFELKVIVISSGQQASCAVGIVVKPVNSPPQVAIDNERVRALVGVKGIQPNQDVLLDGVFHLMDPDLQDFDGWYSHHVHSGHMNVSVSCGSLSFGMPRYEDYIHGEMRGSIAGTEGLTFDAGDGYQDPRMEVMSTLENLNAKLYFLYYHSQDCDNQNVTMVVEFSDLGHFGEGPALQAQGEITIMVNSV